jgi:two-component system cell cycle sensor histidine kinase/response regulator CckA
MWLIHRLRWSGPLLTAPGDPEHARAMARGAVYLYASGSLLVLLMLALPRPEGHPADAIAALCAAGLLGAIAHLLLFDRLPLLGFQSSGAIGALLVAAAVVLAGDAGAAYTFIFVWIVLYAFFFYGLAGAALQLLVVGAAATFAVGRSQGWDAAPLHAVGIVGILAVAGSLVLFVKRRLRRLVDSLSDSEQRYRELVEHMPLTTYVDRVDGRDSDVYTSPQIQTLLGYPPQAWESKPGLLARVLHPEDRERVLAERAHVHATGEPLRTEYRAIAADGRVVWLGEQAVVVRGRDGTPSYLQGFLVDVTSRRELEGKLLQSQRMEAVGRLAGGIAHDFNNILTAVAGYAELAELRSADAGEAVLHPLRQARSAVGRATSLTSQLLAFSKRQVLRLEPLDLNAAVTDVSELVRRLIPASIAVDVELAERDLVVRADRGQLEQVLVNLCVNARDAMTDGGKLAIETRPVDLNGAAAALGVERGSYARIDVTDTGMGMSEAVRRQVFEPFFTTKDDGTGLGLATAYGIVSQMSGHIAVDSTPGAGTTVTVHLPLSPDRPQAETPRVAAPAPGGREVVLVVEDDDTVRSLLAEALEGRGYAVQLAAGGTEALELFNAAEQPPALVVTDVVMPGINGGQLARALRERRPGLPVLFTSGYAKQLIDERDLEERTAFLAKPFSIADVAASVRGLLDGEGVPAGDAPLAEAAGAL